MVTVVEQEAGAHWLTAPAWLHLPDAMGVDPALANLALLVVSVLGILILWHRSRKRTARACNWRKSRNTAPGQLQRWTCRTCGAEGFSATNGQPRTCKRDLRQRPI